MTERCPWCGSFDVVFDLLPEGYPEFVEDTGTYQVAVICNGCYAQGPRVVGDNVFGRDAAMRAWNERLSDGETK